MALHQGAQQTTTAPHLRRLSFIRASGPSQGTKDDHAHTFIVKGIDGPALMKLTDEQLQEWKVKVRHRRATPRVRVRQAGPCESLRQHTGP